MRMTKCVTSDAMSNGDSENRSSEARVTLEKAAAPLASAGDAYELEDARCPICLEHPHNAVLLQCASDNHGCRPYICNTSCRHSNCLDKFVRSSAPCPSTRDARSGGGFLAPPSCPLCRGEVRGWFVDKKARTLMDLKVRACSFERCEFSGSYKELRKHARKDHPFVRPSDVDPERQENWSMMERQNELSDLFGMFLPENYNEAGDDYYEAIDGYDQDEESVHERFLEMIFAATDAFSGETQDYPQGYPQIVAATLMLPLLGIGSLNGASIVITAENNRGSETNFEVTSSDSNNIEIRYGGYDRSSSGDSYFGRVETHSHSANDDYFVTPRAMTSRRSRNSESSWNESDRRRRYSRGSRHYRSDGRRHSRHSRSSRWSPYNNQR